jgi:hypothetical protein
MAAEQSQVSVPPANDYSSLERRVPNIVVVMKLADPWRAKGAGFPALSWNQEADDVDFGTILPRIVGAAKQVVRARVRIHERHAEIDRDRHLRGCKPHRCNRHDGGLRRTGCRIGRRRRRERAGGVARRLATAARRKRGSPEKQEQRCSSHTGSPSGAFLNYHDGLTALRAHEIGPGRLRSAEAGFARRPCRHRAHHPLQGFGADVGTVELLLPCRRPEWLLLRALDSADTRLWPR